MAAYPHRQPTTGTRARRGASARRWIIAASCTAALLASWYLFTGPLGLITSIQFPSPGDTYDCVVQLIGPGYAGATLSRHVLDSLELVLLGFLAAALSGVPLGILMGWSRLAEAYLNPVFQIIRPIAPIAWIPLTILWFGLGTTAKIFVIWLAAFSPAAINSYTGVRNIDPVLIAAARVHGASTRRVLSQVVIPGALPTIFTGLRISLQACWMVLVAAELVGSFAGLGHIMIIATRDLNPGMIFVAMACVAILGVALSLALARIERWAIPWRT